MNTIDLKLGINQFVNETEDSLLLENIYNYILFFSRGESEVDILDQLSDNQRNRLNLSLLQVANRQIISHKQLKSEVAQWLNE